MIKQTKNLLRMSDKVSKNEITEAVNAVLDCVQSHLGGQPVYAK